ncbi:MULTISPECIES: acyltransferase [unclassified Pseudomonas]|uniref:acyltransferase family protein n=1 Tax=unclassified Pseudomonas TaxID=196821 RepID=UPI000D6F566F|nr:MULTISPECIES: acyltransferase [unclassified Pseudomonas]MED5609417.1 acyltransferase [Pseudomonas sp. JH-2]PWU27941.1 acyltransferase [Pseudomonas sp. RW407]
MNITDRHTAPRPAHMPGLDGLRGCAVLTVMVFHAWPAALTGGMIGVDLFFVLSGFLISLLLVEEYRDSGGISLRRFYLRRCLRLLPAFSLLLLVFLGYCLWNFDGKVLERYLQSVALAASYTSNWARAFSLNPVEGLGHTWSLAMEEQFYLFWPLLLLGLLRYLGGARRLVLVALGLALASWGWRVLLAWQGAEADRLYNGLDTRLDALMVGCALGLAESFGLLQALRRPWAGRLLGVLAVVAVLYLAGVASRAHYWVDMRLYYWMLAGVELSAACLVLNVLCNRGGWVERLLSLPGLTWLGRISYGLYLWHFPIYVFMRDGGASPWTILGPGSLLTLLLASLSFYLLERPFLRLKRRYAGTAPAEPRGSAGALLQ